MEAQGINAKRKLNLEAQDPAEVDTSRPSPCEQDSGVKVVVRLRPMNQREKLEEATVIVQRISDDSLSMADQHFTFDRVAGADASQRTMFEIIGLPIVEHCLQGFNSSIFAYGQTGSGKTYTMWGSTQDLATAEPCSEELGLTPRVFQQLFQRIREEEKKNADKQLRYQCRCSFFEIYNEQITDLLEPVRKNLQVREDTKTGVYVENLTEEYVSGVDDVFRLMLRGLGNRKIGSTSMNVDSSRSHSLFTCVIESRCKSMADGVSSVRTSRMNLVDLAGSERQKLTGAAGERLKEAGNINRSLSQLGNLINILAEVSQTGRPRHIPYRDSRLTFLLQESLGGNAKLAMICAISPASSCKSETLSTLRFAQRAKSIKNKAVVNEETENDVNFLREQIRQLKDELMRMKSSESQSSGVGGYSNGWNARRSYNLLRMSLIRPLTLPHTEEDTDEEMEIDEEGVECIDAGEDESIKTDIKAQSALLNLKSDIHADARLPRSILEPEQCQDKAEDVDPYAILELECEAESIESTVQDQTLSLKEMEIDGNPSRSEDKSTKTDIKAHSALLNLKSDIHVDACLPSSILEPQQCHDKAEDVDPYAILELKCESGIIERTIHDQTLKINSLKEMEIDEEGVKCIDTGNPSTREDESIKTVMKAQSELLNLKSDIHADACLPNSILEPQQFQHEAEDVDPNAILELKCESRSIESTIQDQTLKINSLKQSITDSALVYCTDSDISCNIGTPENTLKSPVLSISPDLAPEYALKSPVLSISPHLAPSTLEDPTLSVSPRLQNEDNGSFRIDMLPVVEEDAILQGSPLKITDTLKAAKAAEGNRVKEETRKSSSIRSSLQSSKKLSSPTDRLAASLHRGLQILENHQKGTSKARTSVVRFSFQNPEFDRFKTRDVADQSVQTSPARLADDGIVAVPEETYEPGITKENSSNCDLVVADELRTPVMGCRHHLPQTVEAVLAGAMRRERAMEETLNRKDAEIEQLNRLVRQYKHERECNALLQQSREDKIARLESLMEGSMPTEAFLNEEWCALVDEHKILQEKYDHHPEVTLANIRQQRLSDDLEHYQNFFDLGEKDALLEEVQHLRDQLQLYVESATPRSAKQRRLSLTPRAKMSSVDVNLDGPDSIGLCNLSETSSPKNTQLETLALEKFEEVKMHCSEGENELISLLEEKRMEAEEYKQLAEKRKQEVEGERRCTEEMKEALQIAMEGHARLLDQYAELQEKHIGLLAKHRKMRDAMSEAKKKAGKLGFLGAKWFEAHAAELVTIKLEQEHERQVAKEQIEGLQAQVQDTADAVQAAGELLVRLKEAEEAVLIAQDAAAHSEQDVDAMRREIEKLKRKHSTEIATFQQRLLEARFQRSTVCPMCVMAERVKFQFTEVDAEEAEAALEAEHLAATAAKEGEASLLGNDGSTTLQMLREELEEFEGTEGSYMNNGDMAEADETDESWYEEVQKCNF